MMQNNRNIGKQGEKRAAKYLKKHGYKILARNVHCGHNELDIVAKNKEVIAFVEVKTRCFREEKELDYSRPCLAVDSGKRRRTIDAALAYLRLHPCTLPARMDVIEVCLTREKHPKILKITHIEDAFAADGKTR